MLFDCQTMFGNLMLARDWRDPQVEEEEGKYNNSRFVLRGKNLLFFAVMDADSVTLIVKR